MTKERITPFVTVNIAVLLFGMAGLCAKWIQLPAILITLGRVLFSSAALFGFAVLTKQSLKIKNRRHLALLCGAGVVLALHWWSYLASIQLSTVAIGTTTFAAYPLFVTFLEPLFFHEKIRGRDVLTSALVLVGVLITIPQFSLENQRTLGILVGILSALGYALLTMMNRFFMQHYESTVIAFYEQGTAAIVLLPALLFAWKMPTVRDMELLVFLGVITTAIAHTLFIKSLKYLSAQAAGVISVMESVYGIVLAFLLLGEVPAARELLGAAVIIGVVIMSQMFPQRKEEM